MASRAENVIAVFRERLQLLRRDAAAAADAATGR